MREALLDWYRPRRRRYPWRRTRDPYVVLVSEVMLQQTQASRVVPAFELFVERFPTVEALAAAPRAAVIRAWDGLGYNRRAVALSEATRSIVREHGGRVPREVAALRRLPGVGPYTAAAVVSIVFGISVPAIDVNVARVAGRALLGTDAAAAADVREVAAGWLGPDARDAGDWNQALMDLGRVVCRPVPRCEICPLAASCRFTALRSAPTPPRRRQPAFEGSFRQVRGKVVRALRARERASLAQLSALTGEPLDRVTAAVNALARDGVIDAGPAALAGRPNGRVRLAG